METRAKLSKTLGQIVKEMCKGCGNVESFDKFMEDFKECRDFMDYFKAIWCPRMGKCRLIIYISKITFKKKVFLLFIVFNLIFNFCSN